MSGGKNFRSAHEFCFLLVVQTGTCRKLPQWKQGGALQGYCRVFAGNDGGFFHFLIFHDSNTVTTRDFSCVGSWLNVCDFQEFWWESGMTWLGWIWNSPQIYIPFIMISDPHVLKGFGEIESVGPGRRNVIAFVGPSCTHPHAPGKLTLKLDKVSLSRMLTFMALILCTVGFF